MPTDAGFSTGLPKLDTVLHRVLPGDNIVWRVDSVAQYRPFVEPYCAHARRSRADLIYFRFAKDEPLVEEAPGVDIHELHPAEGFEPFMARIHSVIEAAGPRAVYVFDCLSELAVDWSSDRMLGNFFMLTCPYLYDRGALAYFALLKNRHSFHTTVPVTKTAQIVIDVYDHEGQLYVRPHKAVHRHSKTMHMLHVRDGDDFLPVADSKTTTEVLGQLPWNRLEDASYRLGFWTSTFEKAEALQASLDRGEQPSEDVNAFVEHLLRMLVGSDTRVLELARKYLTLADILRIRRRMVGTGPIGGKSVGMLLARAILAKTDPAWNELLEPHDSFFIGADVYYTYLVQNGLWWTKHKQKDPETFLSGGELARHQVLNGTFPAYIIDQFADILDYFGPSPIILRSSSLLEDAFDSTFAGKGSSVFCINQGSRDQRMEDFISAVRTVYASDMTEEALKYRWARGLLSRDQQMAILVQRVSGAHHGRLYFPDIAGVGLSHNPFVWSEHIDPAAGVLRLVYGLGTRAVAPSGGDFTRILALNAPERQVEDASNTNRKYAQRKIDVLDLDSHERASQEFPELAKEFPDLPLELFASRDTRLERLAAEKKLKDVFPWTLTFEGLVRQTSFLPRMRELLATLKEAYGSAVDVEFTANFATDGRYAINLLQCRPIRVKRNSIATSVPTNLTQEQRILDSRGPVIGFSREIVIDRLIYVRPSVYAGLPNKDRFAVAKVLGQLANLEEGGDSHIMLLGPGRWGTTTPTLGVPISFSDIKAATVICEIVAMRQGLTPDASLGTHFFNELVEGDILYFALFPHRDTDFLNRDLLRDAPNELPRLLPNGAQWENAIRVLESAKWNAGKPLILSASSVKQRVVCYLKS